MKLDRLLLLAITAGSILGLSLMGYANLDVGESRTFVYQGRLELDNAPLTGSRNLRFGLSSSAAANWDCLATATDVNDTCGLWWEPHGNVAFDAGIFSVTLGDVYSLTDAVLAQPELHLAVAIEDPDSPGFTVLPGSQKLSAVPFANRGVSAKNYAISGALTVGEDAVVGGSAYFDDTGNSIRIGGDYTNYSSATQAEIANDTSSYKSLMILGNRSFLASRRQISLWDDVSVKGRLFVDEGMFAISTLSVAETLTADLDVISSATGNPLKLTSNYSAFVDITNDNAEIANDTGTYKTLMILGNRSFNGSTRRVSVWDELNVNGVLNVTDDSGSWSCSTRLTDCESRGGGDAIFLDRLNVSCGAGEVLRQFRLETCASGQRFRYICCEL